LTEVALVKRVNAQFSEELSKAPKEEQSKALDAEVERFSQFMENEVPDIIARGPLMTPEKALLKTYLVQKLTGKLD
jgi:hypothetical protein